MDSLVTIGVFSALIYSITVSLLFALGKTDTPPEVYFESVAIPVYADFRLTGGSKRVTPYMDTKVGCDVNGFDFYAGIEFGANIRSASGSHRDSWWIGVKSDCVDFEAQTIGLTVGKSF